MDLADLGWDDFFAGHHAAAARPDLVPGRVVAEHRDLYRVATAEGERPARLSGRLRHHATARGDLPAVGDWVLLDVPDAEGAAVVHVVLPRRSRFSRGAAGQRTEEQVVAANVDTVWIVAALDAPLGPRRIERYLALAWESGARSAVVLSKADLAADPEGAAREAEGVAPGVPVHALSAVTGEGMEALAPYLRARSTIALLGLSGAGKSTLINRLAGEELLRTGAVREGDAKGRHTTTHRQLVALPGGALVVDTPGMRELQLWDAGEGLQDAFADVEELASACRFADCGHSGEPGCAVAEAVERGELDPARAAGYQKLLREQEFQDRKLDARSRSEENRRVRSVTKGMRDHPKHRR